MKISIIAANFNTKRDIVIMAGRAAGVCYMPDDFDAILHEDEDKTLRRANGTLLSGHHSVYDHPNATLLIEGIPKVLAMVLNNEKMYATSEKSARYTKMEPGEREVELYEKWTHNFIQLISNEYYDRFLTYYKTDIKALKAIEKLAMENARYVISVFTPTTMVHTLSVRQLNYIIRFMEHYIDNAKGEFETQLASYMQEFINAVPDILRFPDLNADLKGREFSLFRKLDYWDSYYGEVYFTSYLGSWAQLAQAQRHRTLSYQMSIMNEPCFYIPPILYTNMSLLKEWKSDLEGLLKRHPQGEKVRIYESGTYDKFLQKCYERVCGCAQLEIMAQTHRILSEYYERRRDLIPASFFRGPRCTFPCFTCKSPCIWGAKDALWRSI